MSSSLRSSTRPAGPGISSPTPYVHSNPTSLTAGAGRRTSNHQMSSVFGSPGGKTKRVRVTAVVGYKPDKTPVTTYEVHEVNSDSDSEEEQVSGPLYLNTRRSPHHVASTSSIIKGYSSSRTPSSEVIQSPEAAWSLSPPGAPRIPFPPTPYVGHTSLTSNGILRNVGLGINMGDESPRAISTYPEGNQERDTFDSFVFHPSFHMIEPRYTGAHVGLGITVDNKALQTNSGSIVDDDTLVDSEDDEEAHYHLPSNLLSPDLIMSTDEFKDSLRRWMERRQGAGPERDIKSDAGSDEENSDYPEQEREQASRRKSI